MSNVTSDDLRDTMLEVTAAVQETMREVMQELVLPQMQGQLIQAWMSAPEKLKEQFKKDNPAGYAAMLELMK